jgi:hypothetical protein
MRKHVSGGVKWFCCRLRELAWDVANGAVYLASDESRWVIGVPLPIDKGLLHTQPSPVDLGTEDFGGRWGDDLKLDVFSNLNEVNSACNTAH